MLPSFLREEARRDLQIAANWYEARQRGLGDVFLDEFLSCVDQVEELPQSGERIDADVRRMLLNRFPYAIFYTIEPTHIEVLGVLHCRRHPEIWRSRL
ncbi:MAG: type II toxin-antitoxin system RelE/ParE family toxin [Gammaproteobacteria bacterium]|nr:type II toxin-antitoxin system RelE/ParE family toxin [Gammaproteobacteria bacterium]